MILQLTSSTQIKSTWSLYESWRNSNDIDLELGSVLSLRGAGSTAVATTVCLHRATYLEVGPRKDVSADLNGLVPDTDPGVIGGESLEIETVSRPLDRGQRDAVTGAGETSCAPSKEI